MVRTHGATTIGPPRERAGLSRWARARDRTGLVVGWGAWLVMSAALFLYVRQYSRNLPLMDDFDMVPVMTGAEPVSLGWAWSQHHEHRPVISRLILVGLSRFVDSDFRTARYANVGLLSAMAASMLLLARRLRGSSRLSDAVLPLSILNVAQAECLLIGFAMNLILSSLLAIALTVAAGLGQTCEGRVMSLGFGLSLVLLPLTGGSGLVMLPPLALWMTGYLIWGWWSGREPRARERAIGIGSLLISSALVASYLYGYYQPAYHPLSPSVRTVAMGALKYLSQGVYPNVLTYWRPAGRIVLAILTATILLLAIVAFRRPGERPRALALLAIILSMTTVAAAVGISRGGLGPDRTMLSRYITLSMPLLSAVYIAWLAYGDARARLSIHGVLLALIVLALPGGYRFSTEYGQTVLDAEQEVEQGLKDHVPTALLLGRACPVLFPDPDFAHDRFKMLKAARMGAFADFEDDRFATAPDPAVAVRR